MKKQSTTRRGFFTKLGLTIGAAVFIETEALADISLNQTSNREERERFLFQYEKWVDQYIEVVEEEKKNALNIENKKRIMELSDEAETWQNKIKEYIKHDDFKEKYISLSKKFANTITPELEA